MTAVTPGALRLLIRLLEAKELVYTHSALVGFHGRPGEELIASGLLEEAGYDHVVRDDDDDGAMVDVESDPYHEGLGHQSRISGFVRVEKQTLLRYAPRIDQLARQLLGDELRLFPAGPRRLDEAGYIWDLGLARLNRQGSTSIWLGRRQHDFAARAALADLLIRSPSPTPRLMLTTTPAKIVPRDHPPGIIVIPIADVLAGMDPALIDFAVLKTRFLNQPVEVIDSPVHLSADHRTLTLNYSVKVPFRKDTHQQKLIVVFVKAYRKGVRLRAADALAEAHCGADSLDQAFGPKWELLKPFLKSWDGRWSFEF